MIIKPKDWYPFESERNFAILCPFHEEKTPSCMILPKESKFHCFGCGEKGLIGEDGSLVPAEEQEAVDIPTIHESAIKGNLDAQAFAEKLVAKHKDLLKRLADR